MSPHFDKSQTELTREIPFGGFRSIDLPFPNNSITTAKYTVAGLLPEMLFQLLQSTGYLWLLVVAAVNVVLLVEGWQRDVADAGVFAVAVSMVFIRNICLELLRRDTDRRVNFEPCRVWGGAEFSDLPSGSLRCGDILYVSNGETVPADAVLFATENPDGVCHVDNSQTLGSAEMMPKRGVPDLQRFVESVNFERTVSILPKLQGMLKTSAPSQDFQVFAGQLRLARAPAAVPLSMANFILRGSRVYGTGWALCCVVATGMESKVMLNARASLHFRSRLEVALYQYVWAGMGLGCIAVIANAAGFLSSALPEENSVMVVLMSIILFYRFLPPMLIVLLELSRFFQILQINRSTNHIRLKSFSNLSSFAHIDYVIADKNTAFTTDKPHVHSLIFRDKIFNQCDGYRAGTHSCLEIVRRRQKNKAAGVFDVLIRCDKEKKSSGDSNEHTYASIKSQVRALLPGLHEPCGFRSLESQLLVGKAADLTRLFECMVLCNTVTQLEPLKAKNKFEEAMVACGERFGFKIMEFSQDKAMLDIHGKRTIYNILAAREYSKAAKRVRVIAERANGTHGVLYVKGSVELVGALLDVEDELFDQIRVISLEMKQSGLVPIMLACKQLSSDQLDTVKDQIWRAQSAIINVDSKIDAILSQLETGLHYLGIACLEDPIAEATSEGVRKLAQAGVKLWLVSNDSETESLAACMRSGFFDEEGYVVPLKGIEDIRECERILGDLVCEFIYRKPTTTLGEELSSGMTARTAKMAPTFEKLMSELSIGTPITRKCEYLDLLSTPFDYSSVNFRLLMDGSTFETALLTEECQRLLAALLYTAKVVCLFAALPHQKAKLVRFLKHSFAFRPTVLSFADSLSSLPMLNESDTRIGLRHGSEPPSQYLFDAKTASLAALADFMVVAGRFAVLRFSAIAVMTIGENGIVATLMAVYMWKCGFSANSPIDMTVVWAITCVATKPLMIYVALKSRDIEPESAVACPQLYTFQTRHFKVAFLMKTVAKSVFVGLFIAFWMDFDMKTALSPDGGTENALTLTGSLSIALFLTVTGCIVAEHMELNTCFWLSFLLNIALFLLESVLLNYFSPDLVAYMEMTLSIPQLVLKAVVIPLFPIALSYAMHAYNGLFQASMVAHLGRTEPCIRHVSTLARLWTPSDCGTPPKSKDLFERQRFMRTFKMGSLEDNYQLSILPELIRQLQTGFLVVTLVAFGSAAQAIEAGYAPKYTPLRLIFAAFCACLFAFSLSKPYKNHYIAVNTCSLVLFSVFANLYYILSSNSSSEVAIALPIFSFLSFHVCYSVVFLLISMNLLSYMVIGVVNILLTDMSPTGVIALLCAFLEVLAVSAACAIAGHYLDEINREKFRLLTTQENELEKADNILKYLLPEFVCSRVKNGVKFIAEIQPLVHILFCEICDFDHIIKDYEAEEVLTLLNHIYEKFDEICENCGVTKVETVGKVYMACTGVKESEQDLSLELPRVSQAQRLLYFAFEIIAAMEQYRLADGQPLRIKVGIHSGKVIAGVVGYHKPQFSLVGDTVNTASRMCSTLTEQNAVQVSGATYAVLKNTFGVLFESSVKQVKGKGLMEVYTAQREVGTRQLKEDMEVPDATPELQPRNSSSVSRGITVARRNSVFEGSSEVVKSFQEKKTMKQKLRKLLKCNMSTDKHYQETLELRRPEAVLGLSVIFAASVVSLVLESMEFVVKDENWKGIVSRTISSVALGLLTFLSKPLFASLYFSWVALVALAVSAAALILQSYLIHDLDDLSSDTNLAVLMVLSAVHFSGMRSTQIVPFLALVSAGITVNYIHYSEVNDLCLRLACILGEIIVFFVFSLNRDVRLNKYIELKQAVKTEIEKTDHLLENLLPQHVLDNMKLERNITDYLSDTTLIVADIVGFTAWSNEREPSEVIEMLSNMFTAFDQLCLKYKTYKVYTIGDCYIAMGLSGKQDYRDPKQECLNVVEMALEMKEVIAKVNDDYFTNLDMRMGVHTGEIIGAIVGTNIVRYDVYGRDVLIAFKMEANSKPGFINVSQASMAFLEEAAPGSYTYEANTTVDISAIGAKVPCYFVIPTSPA